MTESDYQFTYIASASVLLFNIVAIPKTFDKSVSKFLVYPFGVATFTYDYGSKPCYPGVHPCQLNMRYPKIWSLISFPTVTNMCVASTIFRHMKHSQKQSPPNHVDNCFDAWRPHCFIILNIHFPWLAGLQLIYSWFLFSNSKPLVYQRVNVNFPICFHHFPAFSHSSLALCDLRLFGRLLRALRHSRRRHRRHCRHRHWGPAVWFRWSLLMIIAKNPCLANSNSWTKPWSTVHWCLFMLC